MKKILLSIMLFLSTFLLAQSTQKTIIIKDAETNLPIEDAAVFVFKTKQLLVSNVEGKVNISLNSNSGIQISHTAYLKIVVKWSSLKNEVTVITLKPNTTNLDELILTKNPQKILKNLVENSKKRLTIPGRLKVYAREFFKLNDINSYYNDGLINFQLYGKTKKIDSNILVEQNRSFGLVEEEVFKDLLGYNLNNIMENYYSFKYLNPILEPKAKKQFEFVLKVYSTNKAYNIFKISPTDKADGLKDEFSIIYDPKNNIIISISTNLNPEIVAKTDKRKAVGAKNIYKSIFKANYRFDDQNYYLLNSIEEIGFEKVERESTKKIEVKNYFLTTNFSNQNYSYNESDVFKEKTLFNKKNQILSDYWNVSGIVATDEELEIIKSIAERR